jgi:DNA-binding winged helix-turn-helix (wHTH) protein
MTVPFECGNWSVDDTQVLRSAAGNRRLSSAHAALLRLFVARVNDVVSMSQLLTVAADSNSLAVQVSRLRKILEEAASKSQIINVPGRGYMLRCEDEIAVRPVFTAAQWNAIKSAVAIAEKYSPGIAARARLPG